jgi:hypothetical protein
VGEVIATNTPTPQTRPFSEMKQVVARYVKGPQDTEVLELAGQALNEGIRKVNTELWQFALSYDDVVLAAGTADYPVPTDWLAPRTASLLDADGNPVSHLDWFDPKMFDHTFPTTTDGVCAYTVFNKTGTLQVTLNASPDAAFVGTYPNLRLRYFANVQFYADDQDTLLAPSYVELFLLWFARFEVAAYWDASMAPTAERMWRDQWAAMKRLDARAQVSDWSRT